MEFLMLVKLESERGAMEHAPAEKWKYSEK